MSDRVSAFLGLSRRWLALGLLAIGLLALGLWWARQDTGRSPEGSKGWLDSWLDELERTSTRSETPSDSSADSLVFWLHEPRLLLRPTFEAWSAGGAGDAPPGLGDLSRWPRGAHDLLALLSARDRFEMVGVFDWWSTVTLKAIGLARSDPWLKGGRVEIAGQPARVSWQRGGGAFADRWTVRPLPLLSDSTRLSPGLHRGAGTPQAALASGRFGVWRWVAGDAAETGHETMRWRRMVRSKEAERSGEVRRWREAGDGAGSAPWWSDPPPDLRLLIDPSATGSDLIVLAIQRLEHGWRALLWSDSPLDVDGDSVSIQIPRAVSLNAVSLAVSEEATAVSRSIRADDLDAPSAAWTMPGEKLARSLRAEVEDVDIASGEGSLRVEAHSLDPRTLEVARHSVPALDHWASTLAPGDIALWVRPARLFDWLEGLAAFERTMPRSLVSSGDGLEWTALAGPLGGLKPILDQIREASLHLSQDGVTITVSRAQDSERQPENE